MYTRFRDVIFWPVCAVLLVFPFHSVLAHVSINSAPTTSCGTIATTDLTTHVGSQIDSRLLAASSSNGLALYNTRSGISTTTQWVRNPNSWTAKNTPLDFTGVSGANDNLSNIYQKGATLVTPRHFITADHFFQPVGSKIFFITATGTPVMRTVTGISTIAGTDINVGVLDSDVPDTITYYPIMSSSTLQGTIQKFYNQNLDVPITLFNQLGQAHINPLNSLDSDTIHYGSYYGGVRAGFSSDVFIGDSGQPGFMIIDNQPVLLFTIYTTTYSPNLGNYITNINAAITTLGSGGYQLTQYNPTCFATTTLDHIPVFQATSSDAFFLNQRSINNALTLRTFLATDVDAGQQVSYSLSSLQSNTTSAILDPSLYFSINASTGAFRQIASLDTSAQGPTFTLRVVATDNSPNIGTSSISVPISIFDVGTSQALPDSRYLTSAASSSSSMLAIDSSDRVVVGLSTNVFGATSSTFMFRLNADGTRDNTFNPAIAGSESDNIYSMFVQSDGKIVISGVLPDGTGFSSPQLVRLNSNGTKDTAFATNLGSNLSSGSARKIAPYNNQILVFSNVGSSTGRITRLNNDGTLDATFQTNIGSGFLSSFGNRAIFQYGQQIIIGGNFTSFNGVSKGHLLRLNADGTSDTAFDSNIGTGFDGIIRDIQTLSNGKILVTGSFSFLNGSAASNIVLLNSDGTRSTSFSTNIGSSVNNFVTSALVQSNDKILIQGFFTSFNGMGTGNILRLNSDGTLDTSFQNNIGLSLNSDPSSFVQKSDGAIIVSGSIRGFDSASVPNIISIITSPQNPPTLSVPASASTAVVPINGSASPFAVVSLFDGSTFISTSTANTSGVWTMSPSFTEGSHSIRASQGLTVTTNATSTLSGAQTLSVSLPVAASPSGGGGGGGGGGGAAAGIIYFNRGTSTNSIVAASSSPILLAAAPAVTKGCTGGTFNIYSGVRCPANENIVKNNSYSFQATLKVGARNAEVLKLQQFLNSHGFFVALKGSGSIGNETTLFGPATKAALMKYQISKGIVPAQGYFGPVTRQVINNTK